MATTVNVPAGVTSSNLIIDGTLYDRMNVFGEDAIASSCSATKVGQIHVSAGGQVQDTIVFNSGWLILSGGKAFDTQLSENGSETILSNGVEAGAEVWSGGAIFVSSGTCKDAAVYDGGLIRAAGTVSSTTIHSGGSMEITSGGKAKSCTISDGGTLLIRSRGFATTNTVLPGGRMTVYENASGNSTTIGTAAGIGNALLAISGGYVYNTTIYSGGSVTFENDTALGSQTVLRGGAIQGGDLLLSRNTSDTFANDCKILFENGGTATVSTLTIQEGGLMQVDSKSTVHFQNIVLDGGSFTMSGLPAYDPAAGTCRKLLDCTATGADVWTEDKYQTLLNATDAVFSSAFLYRDGDLYLRGITHVSSGATGEEAFATVEAALTMSPTGLVIENGTFSAYDPEKEENNVPTFNGLPTVINGGLFTTSVCGGYLYQEPGTSSTSMETENVGEAGNKQNITLTINGGVFNKSVFAGDRVNREYLTQTRTGDISLTITGGEFNNAVGGAMALTEIQANAKLIGNVNLTITGGTFNNTGNKGWIYGGSIATTKTIAGTTTIFGNVTVTLDATDNAITVANLVAGSYGFGKIKKKEGGDGTDGNTNLVLTGANNITATGEIWGGCSGDVIRVTKIKKADETDSGNREVDSMVEGSRILTFTGFEGTLTSEANKIRAFSDIEVINGSKATVANAAGGSVNLSDVVNWTFGAPTGNWDEEDDCMLTGNFINDFNGDTLILSGFYTAGSYVLLTDSSRLDSNDVFNAFNQLSAIKMDDNTVSANFSQNPEAQTMTWAWAGGESWLAGSLEVNRSTGKMTLVTQAVIV